jgi:hypothetical protein
VPLNPEAEQFLLWIVGRIVFYKPFCTDSEKTRRGKEAAQASFEITGCSGQCVGFRLPLGERRKAKPKRQTRQHSRGSKKPPRGEA